MIISEIRKWAKEKGYTITKTSRDDKVVYLWCKNDDSVCGEESSVSKVATAVYNHLSDYKWVEYQEEYKNKEL